jgi:hypothetical protein
MSPAMRYTTVPSDAVLTGADLAACLVGFGTAPRLPSTGRAWAEYECGREACEVRQVRLLLRRSQPSDGPPNLKCPGCGRWMGYVRPLAVTTLRPEK